MTLYIFIFGALGWFSFFCLLLYKPAPYKPAPYKPEEKECTVEEYFNLLLYGCAESPNSVLWAEFCDERDAMYNYLKRNPQLFHNYIYDLIESGELIIEE